MYQDVPEAGEEGENIMTNKEIRQEPLTGERAFFQRANLKMYGSIDELIIEKDKADLAKTRMICKRELKEVV